MVRSGGGVGRLGLSGCADRPPARGGHQCSPRKLPAGIIIDLSKVDFLACAGINTLLAAHADVTPDTRFGVVADGPATSRPLTLLGVDRELGLYRSLDDALKAGRDDVSPM